jgi:zinc transport system permease protein
MLDDFFVRALLGGVGVALTAGPLGAFVVWRRMAYFGEALANSALLGLVLGLLLDISMLLGVVVFCCLLALLLGLIERQRLLPLDTALSILAHGALAIGLLSLSLMGGVRVDLMSYLFGDILAVSRADLLLIFALLLLVGTALALLWRPLLSMTAHADLAAVEGVKVEPLRLLLTLLVAAAIAAGMKIVGVLLIISLLVVPAAAARRLSATPEQMALWAALIGAASVVAGLGLSLHLDVPAGPAIVAAAVATFALLQLLPPRAAVE